MAVLGFLIWATPHNRGRFVGARCNVNSMQLVQPTLSDSKPESQAGTSY